MNDKISDTLYKIIDMLVRKNHDYSSANIAFTGIHGVVVRLCDKAFRLHNLVENKQQPNFESIEDTLQDTIAYCIIGHLLLDAVWGNQETYLQDQCQRVIAQLHPLTDMDMSFERSVDYVYMAVRDLYGWSEHTRPPEEFKLRLRSIINLCLAAMVLRYERNTVETLSSLLDENRIDIGRVTKEYYEGIAKANGIPPEYFKDNQK